MGMKKGSILAHRDAQKRKMSGSRAAIVVVGNDYKRIPLSQAKRDRSRRYRKVHDWKLYVDVVGGDVDVIKRVDFCMDSSFSPRIFQHHSPVSVSKNGGASRWRFATRQQTYSTGCICQIKIYLVGGAQETIKYRISDSLKETARRKLVAPPNAKLGLGPVLLPPETTFGIELELTSASHHTPDQVAGQISHSSGKPVDVMIHDHASARATHQSWKLMGDASIQCNIDRPNCNAFELVSPILHGTTGLPECQAILKSLNQIRSIRVNKTMGFHVHVNVANANLPQLVKICQNFIKYERVMDSIMPNSRRQNSYCRSNFQAVPGTTNKAKHNFLAGCQTLDDLVAAMNPQDSRYFKLNLMNLKTGRQPTLEFRQHSATASPEKVLNWVRLCVSFVSHSIRLKAPTSLRQNRTLDEQTNMMFQYVVKDRYLAKFYKKRQAELPTLGYDGASCCSSCSSAGSGVCKRYQ